MTTDPAKAREWLELWTDVSGVEGILCKPLTSRYMPGSRGGWTKVRRRDTIEAIIGAITGTLTRPQLLVLGRHDTGGRLRAVGLTVPLRPEAARLVAEHLAAADPGHPWEGVTFTATWGSVTSWTCAWSAPTWWPRSAPTARSTGAASCATRCASSGCAWTWALRMSRCSGRARPPHVSGASALRVAAALAPVVAEALAADWAPEWSGVTGGLLEAVKALVTLRRGRGGRPRS
ncbi:hypothetical protein [Streptomyces sp. NPDC088762]|uniref:hypothetical protein n=1 Tax=Streptomyces sp. NPDC088762 TaxID=3365891 RepID=UPI00380ACA08